MMVKDNPVELDRLFEQAFNAGDIDAMVALYEPQAALMPSPSTGAAIAFRCSSSSGPGSITTPTWGRIHVLVPSSVIGPGFGARTSVTHPGGNITGFSAFEFSIGGKWIELLKEVAPKLARAAVMSNPDTSPQTEFFRRAIQAAAPTFKIEIVPAPVAQAGWYGGPSDRRDGSKSPRSGSRDWP